MARIVILATLDTKAEEARFLAERVAGCGHAPWILDTGIAGRPPFEGDTARGEVAAAASSSLPEIAALSRTDAMQTAAKGAAALVHEMVAKGEAQGVIGIGGGTGTWLGTAIMRDLPIGFPKVLVSTMSTLEGATDIMAMPSVADIAGVNALLAPILANAAAAICGMAEKGGFALVANRRQVALTMFGVTTAGGTVVRRCLEQAGCEVVVFHANGTGGATMEGLLARGMFDAVLDWTTSEVTDEVAGGVCTAGPQRLEAAGRRGIPQLVVPGAVDVINLKGGVAERFRGRPFHMHLPTVPLVRASAEESAAIGRWIGRKLNAAEGPVQVLIPEKGYSALDRPGGVFEDVAANAAFVVALRNTLRPGISVRTLPHHINDEAFATAAAATLLAMMNAKG